MDFLITELVAIFVLAVLVGVLFRFVGLPSIIGQVIVGLGVGMSGLIRGQTMELMQLLASLGITLLLFLVGLEMNWSEIKKVGKKVGLFFLGQTALLGVIFYILTFYLLGTTPLVSLMLSVALSFSSTIVVVKVLSEKRDLSSLVGRLSLGVLLLQDLLAIILLVILPNLSKQLDGAGVLDLILRLLVFVFTINVVGHFLVSGIARSVIKTGDDLILLSLSWFMAAIYLATKVFGLSAEIGSFLAGLSLSTSWGHFQIVNKVKTLRDVFLTLFFVLLGLQVGSGRVDWTLVTLLTMAVLLIKFLVSFLWSRVLGLSGRISFLVSLNMTQISEFSLVVMALGLSAHLWNEDLVRVVTVVGLLTMTISSVLITINGPIFRWVSQYLPFLLKIGKEEKIARTALKDHVILFGCDRTGRGIMSYLEKRKEKYLVVDFNPDVVNKLKGRGVNIIFADASDPDIFELTNMKESKMVISTIKDAEDSLALLVEARSRGIKIPMIVDAETAQEAKTLYNAGATYVLFPHFVGGWHMNQLLLKHKTDKDTFKKYKMKQDEALKAIYEGEY